MNLKKIITLIVIVSSIVGCQSRQDKTLKVLNNSDSSEITFILELNTKDNLKSEVSEFTQYLSDFIVEREPSSVYGLSLIHI